MTSSNTLTAGLILIGNELLAGQTHDQNLSYIAKILVDLGIQLKEVVVIADIEEDIIRVVRDHSRRFTYVFTTGGIGPTHDDITAAAIAKAFNRPLVIYPEIMEMFEQKYGTGTPDLTQARLQMATLPQGSLLIPNKVATAPGFQVENVFVMAGVPVIMRSMMESAVTRLEKRRPPVIKSVSCHVTEGKLATGLAKIQTQYPNTEIGSYPHWIDDHPDSLKITIKGHDLSIVEKVTTCIYELCQQFDQDLEVSQG